MKRYICIMIGLILLHLNAETLFEVKDASDNKVLDVSTDGLRILNMGDTLMVISSSEIKANIDNSKGLSRSFSISTTTSKKGSTDDIMKISGDSTRFWVNDSGSGFKVATKSLLATKASADTSFTSLDKYNSLIGQGTGIKLNPYNAYGNRYNTMIGYKSGFNTEGIRFPTDASFNIFIGYKSGFNNIDGSGNIYIGNNTGYLSENESANTILGTDAGYNTQSSANTFVGFESGNDNTTGSSNTFFGAFSGAFNTIGHANSYFGNSSAYKYSGGYNVMMGNRTGLWNGSGTGDYNVFIGYEAGAQGTAAGNSIFSGSNNVAIGYQAGLRTVYSASHTGTGNVLIGYQAGMSSSSYSNRLYIDNSSTTTPLIYGDFASNALTVNGTLTVTGNTAHNGNTQFKSGTSFGKIQAGELTVGTGGSGINAVTLTFPLSFSAVPKVTVTPRCADGITTDIFVANVRNITTTNCVVMIYRLDSPGSSWGQNLKIDWYAWE